MNRLSARIHQRLRRADRAGGGKTAARDTLQAAWTQAPGAAADAWPKETISALVKIRDDLLAAIRRGGDGAAMARWAYEQLGGVLKLEGVEPVEREGLFDPQRQEALETRQTDDPAKDRTVAATVRPGYAAGHRLIRAQEVVIYALRGDARRPADPHCGPARGAVNE